MRRRWPVLVATIPLVFAGALVAAYPAAAQAGLMGRGGPVQSGGPIRHLSQPGGRIAVVTRGRNTVVTSSNWAGYAAAGANGTFTSVSSSWTQPAGHCTSGNQYAAFWIGLDGYTSGTVEQTGSEVDCAWRTPRYYAWYEMYPGGSVTFPNRVSPGDQFAASVTYQGSGRFRLVLKDTTKGWTQTVSAALAGAALSSAEVIAEAPCCTAHGGALPLTNFGTVSFSSATANGMGMSTFDPVEITMPDTSVSPMSGAGNFTVSYAGFTWPFGR
jgi:hypothetical protein